MIGDQRSGGTGSNVAVGVMLVSWAMDVWDYKGCVRFETMTGSFLCFMACKGGLAHCQRLEAKGTAGNKALL